MALAPFHLAVPTHSIAEARRFYGEVLVRRAGGTGRGAARGARRERGGNCTAVECGALRTAGR
jgi:hypothetical protein